MSQDQNTQMAINGLLAQLDAHKEQIQELLSTSMTLRTNLIWVKKVNQDLNTKILDLENKLKDAESKAVTLDSKPACDPV